MSDYTPTTEEIQSRYVYAADFTVSEEMDAWGEFDRWLERHDAEVYQRGREDAAKASEEALRKAGGEPQPAGADDPYSFANGFTYAGLIAIAAARGDGAE